MAPELPLFVVAEFEPHRGQWIPWHFLLGFRENLAAVRAAIGDRRIHTGAMLLSPAVPLGKMRIAAVAVAGRALIAYDEEFRVVRGAGWGN